LTNKFFVDGLVAHIEKVYKEMLPALRPENKLMQLDEYLEKRQMWASSGSGGDAFYVHKGIKIRLNKRSALESYTKEQIKKSDVSRTCFEVHWKSSYSHLFPTC
jgi:hypothetical protein